jgi:hypothetical protein
MLVGPENSVTTLGISVASPQELKHRFAMMRYVYSNEKTQQKLKRAHTNIVLEHL